MLEVMTRKGFDKLFIILITVICILIWYMKHQLNGNIAINNTIMQHHIGDSTETLLKEEINVFAEVTKSKEISLNKPESNFYTSSGSTDIKKSFAFELKRTNKTCRTYKTFQTYEFCLPNSSKSYTWNDGSFKCLIDGTSEMNTSSMFPCTCKPLWHGQHCHIPHIVKMSNYPHHFGVRLLEKPRNIIYTFPFTIEFDLLEARLAELDDLIDVYVILESTHTASGLSKLRYLRDKLVSGYLKEYQNKIFLVTLPFFPTAAFTDGWVADALLRNYISEIALPNIYNLNEDDIIILSDADEVPSRAAVLYLKVNFGYPQPIGFSLRHNIFNFGWRGPGKSSVIYGACTVSFLNKFLDGKLYDLRWAPRMIKYDPHKQLNFMQKVDSRLQTWNFGEGSGWHCSWCLSVEGIRYKMLAAHVSDVPRWGSIKSKTSLDFIRNVSTAGIWFDSKTLLTRVDYNDPNYAPSYFLRNREKFATLLNI